MRTARSMDGDSSGHLAILWSTGRIRFRQLLQSNLCFGSRRSFEEKNKEYSKRGNFFELLV